MILKVLVILFVECCYLIRRHDKDTQFYVISTKNLNDPIFNMNANSEVRLKIFKTRTEMSLINFKHITIKNDIKEIKEYLNENFEILTDDEIWQIYELDYKPESNVDDYLLSIRWYNKFSVEMSVSVMLKDISIKTQTMNFRSEAIQYYTIASGELSNFLNKKQMDENQRSRYQAVVKMIKESIPGLSTMEPPAGSTRESIIQNYHELDGMIYKNYNEMKELPDKDKPNPEMAENNGTIDDSSVYVPEKESNATPSSNEDDTRLPNPLFVTSTKIPSKSNALKNFVLNNVTVISLGIATGVAICGVIIYKLRIK